MQSKKKMIVNTVFLVVIFALTIYGVFHGEDLGAMMEAMRRADVRWLLPGLFCVVFFIWGESIITGYKLDVPAIFGIFTIVIESHGVYFRK